MSEWIKCSERLPKEAPVMVCFLEPRFGVMTQEIGVAYYDHPDDYENPDDAQGWLFWLNDKEILGGGVTHWMPLPPAPTEEE